MLPECSSGTTRLGMCTVCGVVVLETDEHFKPCACPAFAHVNCAKEDSRWANKKCPKCGQLHFKAEVSRVQPSAAKTRSLRVTSRMCVVCHNTKFQEKTAARHDARMLRPCFCEFDCHHGCMLEVLRGHRRCHLCGVEYRYFKYGSLRDYFVRYACQYILFSLFALSLSSLAGFALYRSLSGRGPFSLARLLLLIIGSALGCVCFVSMFMCCRHTIFHRFPRFRRRYGQITLLPYEPQSPSNKRRNCKTKEKGGSFSRAAHGDISLGQYLFGNNDPETWQSSSTPLAPPGQQVKFTFDTPCGSDICHDGHQ